MPRFAKVRINTKCAPKQKCPAAERMWLRIKHCNDGLCEGVLDNQPVFATQIRMGDSLLFKESDIIERRSEGLDGILDEHPMLPWLVGGAALLGFVLYRRRTDQAAVDAVKAPPAPPVTAAAPPATPEPEQT